MPLKLGITTLTVRQTQIQKVEAFLKKIQEVTYKLIVDDKKSCSYEQLFLFSSL
jgi:hypothetical protein